MDLESFKNLAAAAQSLVIATGVLIGGIWALYRFKTLRTIEKALAELEKAKRELTSRGTLDIKLIPTQLDEPDHSASYICLEIEIKNIGTRTETIRWEDSRVEAARVARTSDKKLKLEEQSEGSYLFFDFKIIFSTIGPQQTDRYFYIIPVEKVGIYLVSAYIVGSPAETEAHIADARSAGLEASTVTWAASTYFRVEAALTDETVR